MRIAVPALILLLLLAVPGRAADAPTVQVETVPLRQETVRSTVDGYGTVTTGEEDLVDISFLHAGQITRIDARAGERVAAGQKLVELATDPVALANYQKAVSAVEFAQRELARTKTQFAQHLATNAEVAAAQKALDDAMATLATEQKIGDDKPTEIATAPANGYVAALSAAPGDRIQAGTTVLKLARSDRVRITVGLEPEQAQRVRPGMAAEVVAVFAPERKLEGTVQGVGGTLNPTSKLVDTWIGLAPGADTPIAATAVSVRIVIEQHTGWVVPRNAVLRDDKGSYLFQVKDGKARRVAVRTGIDTDQTTEVSGDLDPAQPIVAVGNYELQDGMAVREPPTRQSGE
jgi:membrane fusion protein (multidrug efflux system)